MSAATAAPTLTEWAFLCLVADAALTQWTNTHPTGGDSR